MKTNLPAMLSATAAATVTFLVADMVVETVLKATVGISVVDVLTETRGTPIDPGFHIVNLAAFAAAMLAVVYLYSVVRGSGRNRMGAVTITSVIAFVLNLSFMVQAVNSGVLPVEGLVGMAVSNVIGLPLSVAVAGLVYDRRVV